MSDMINSYDEALDVNNISEDYDEGDEDYVVEEDWTEDVEEDEYIYDEDDDEEYDDDEDE